MMEERYAELKIAEKGAYVSIIAYIVLSVLKLVFGYWGNSEALKADGLNNTTDIVASIAVLVGLRLARLPADNNHTYGHWKAETVASMVTSFIMLAVGLEILYSTLKNFLHHETIVPDMTVAYVAIFSAIVMYAVYFYNKNLAKKNRSGALLAAAKDNRSDAWVSIGTAIAILGSQMHMPWLDNLTAILVALLVLKTAIDIFRKSAFSLSDGFDEETLEVYRKEILKIPDILEVPSIKARSYGANIFVEVIIWCNPQMTVKRSHEITEIVEQLLKEKYHVFETIVHVEPSKKLEHQ